jgi:hypothetical protein
MAQIPPSLLFRLRVQPADGEAWQRFDSLYRPLLRAWLRRYSIRTQDAEDLVQQVLAVLVRELPHFQYDREKRFDRGNRGTENANTGTSEERSEETSGTGRKKGVCAMMSLKARGRK